MKKTISVLVVLVLIMALAVPAFAANADEVEPVAVCTNHVKGSVLGTDTSWSASGSTCYKVVTTYYECSNCHNTFTSSVTTAMSHVTQYVHATCNGSVQTVTCQCANCSVSLGTKTVACPGAVHSGQCKWLVA